ncbi:MAG TPA: ABC transporter ATP-binding protein [Spirochaetota bacterium]|jgi:ABC-type cobalamin/Fe3+-siderophores transport system ATPase subunit|nr:ABC transporter ATP-binding protein [Spirochaetota bacterium]
MFEIRDFKAKIGNFNLGEIDLRISEGEILSLCGKSSSGKSVFISSLSGAIKNPSGDFFFKSSCINNELKSYISSNETIPSKDESVTVKEFFYLSRRKIKGKLSFFNEEDKSLISELSSNFGLKKYINDKIQNIPHSAKNLLFTAAKISQSKKILLLDAPEALLDPLSLKILSRELIKYSKKSNIIIMANNDPNFSICTADSIAIMNEGKIIKQGDSSVFSNNSIKDFFETEGVIGTNIESGKKYIRFF